MSSLSLNQHYLAIDQGGHASRALLFDQQGHILSQATKEIKTYHPQTYFVEHDPIELIHSVEQAITSCLDGAKHIKLNIACAGLATQRSSIICWNKVTGEPLSNILSWQDRRAAHWMNQFLSHTHDIHRITGLYPSPHYGVSKIHWCLENLAEVNNALTKNQLIIGPLASYIAFKLCQEHPIATDPANGSRTLLLNLKTMDWDENLLKQFNIPQSILPPCKTNTHHFGTIKNNDQEFPLTLITGDQSAALFHNGFPDSKDAHINIGTGAFVQRTIPHPMSNNVNLLSSLVYSDEEKKHYVLEGTINGAGSALAWFAETTQTTHWQNHIEDWLDQPADDLFFINAVGGIASPYWQSEVLPDFMGEGSVAEKFCAIVESTLFLIMKNLETMKLHLPNVNNLVISGGLSQSNTLCQRLADLSTTPVLRPEEKEATARGVCFLLKNDKSLWKSSDITTFSPRSNPKLLQRYECWLLNFEKIVMSQKQ